MNKDILNDYFSKSERLDQEPREGFKEELLRSLNMRIVRLEQLRRLYSILSILSIVVTCIVAIGYYLPFDAFRWPTFERPILPTLNFSPLYILLAFLSFSIIFVASYFISLMEVKELRRQLLEGSK